MNGIDELEEQELARLAAIEAAQRVRLERLERSGAGDDGSDPAALTMAKELWQEAADRREAYQSGTVKALES